MKAPKIVCLGDSLTEGYDINKAYRWTNLLSADLGIDIINSGISGDSTAGMLARFQNMVIAHQPSHLIIMGGTNDLRLNLPNEQILSHILSMTRHARYHDILAIIGLPTPFYAPASPFDDSVFLGPLNLTKRIENFRQLLKQWAMEDDRPFIDFALNMTPDLFLEDGLHPNEAGHLVMKENAKAVLQNILPI